ncbi:MULTISPECIES: COG4315 family predicted lipoprotein [unclassified Streptomyces]|uniref:COG4315 family predicted lipoprotein n=1 Tax=unclassified Streptomyces TaxID=2593676 RepID=UPI00352F4176|nr:hypothetical protein OG725_34660 [Streptomyces sp. NBC_01213]
MRHHTRTATALASVLLVAAAAAGCSEDTPGGGSTGGTDTEVRGSGRQADAPAAASKSPSATVSARKGMYGESLVDDKGMTIYVFDKDTENKSNCTGACAKAWPPLLVAATPTAGKGVESNLLKTTPRSDGKKQVTYNGHPLYRFDEDQKAGDTDGQAVDAFGAKWYVIGPEGKRITTEPTNGTDGGY